MSGEDDGGETPTEEHGITDEDKEQIAAYLDKPRYERSVDDLCPSPEK